MSGPALNLSINGDACRIPPHTTLRALVRQRAARRKVAVLVNANVIPATQWEKFRLSEGDQVEIVSFAGGG